MKKIKIFAGVLIFISGMASFAFFGLDADKKESNTQNNLQEKANKDCEIPAFAKAIGHEDMWLLHNGCPPRKERSPEEKNIRGSK